MLNQEAEARRQWSVLVNELKLVAAGISFELKNVTKDPPVQLPIDASPRLSTVPDENGNATNLESVLRSKRAQLRDLVDLPIAIVSEAAPSLERELARLSNELVGDQLLISQRSSSLQASKSDLHELEERLVTLREDIRHYEDLSKLKTLGSKLELSVASGECPTCHQPVSESLLAQDDTDTLMSLEQNLEFLREQRRTFDQMLGAARVKLELAERRLSVAREELALTHSRIRTLKATLIQDGRAPSLAEVQQRAVLVNDIERLNSALVKSDELILQLETVAVRHIEVDNALRNLPEGRLTQSDLAKLSTLRDSLVDHEQEYGFDSFNPELLEIDPNTFMPTRDGFNLGFDTSASDGVRLIWGYSLGLMEVARSKETNHPGMLLIDEPQQHKPDQADFKSFLRRSAESFAAGQQVIVATSEREEVLRSLCEEFQYSIVPIRNRVLRRLTRTS